PWWHTWWARMLYGIAAVSLIIGIVRQRTAALKKRQKELEKNIEERIAAEKEREKLLHDIGERLKELNCMYTISNSIRTKESLDEIFQDTVNAIPPGWHYPKITRAKLYCHGKEWVSDPFEETKWKQSSDIVVNGEKCGDLEVYYLEECPPLDEGPFMNEERDLIDSLSRTLSETIERKKATEDFFESEKKYRELVDNSLVGVFTTTLDGKFIFANDAIVQMYNFDNTEQMLAEGSLARWKEPKQREQLMTKLKKYGAVTNFEAESITYTGRHIHILFSIKLQKNNIIGMVMDITERKLAEEAILKYQRRLKDLANELTITEEKQRRQIATDLHDHVGQILASSRLQMAALNKSMDKEDILKKLKNISGGLSDSIKATRDAIFELSPPQLNEIGLAAALSEWMNKELEIKHGIKYELTSTDKKYPINNEVRYLLFRCACELLVNVVKHARAS
ncbi:MAG: PAS domain S-box protein, partial [Cyclobacteriaceae bacterium]|nr:PAS domain S-box protein [Cyclobacteriaceae bacterium]